MSDNLYDKIGENCIFMMGAVVKYSQHCYIGQLFLDKTEYRAFVLDIVKKKGNILTLIDVTTYDEYTIELTPKENKKISNFDVADIIPEDKVFETIKELRKDIVF